MEKTTLKIKVIPRSKENKLVSFEGDLVKIKIHAIPEDNKANEMLIEYLSKVLKIKKDQVTILKGKTSRDKVVSIEGLSLKEIVVIFSNLLK